MDFGVLDSGADPDEVLRMAVRAEELGFSSIFVGHHRFTPGFGFTQHPWIMLSAIAARTEHLRLGTSIFLLPLANPLDVAEEVASLDVLSKGRVIFGPGLGYRPYEYEALGLPYHRRGKLMSECLEVVQLAWEQERFSHQGEFFSFDDVGVTPRPVQKPRPPIWVGANSDAGMHRAARLADGWTVGFSDRLPKLVPRLADYRKRAADSGRTATVCLMRLVGIGETREQVDREWLPEILKMLRSYARVEAPAEKGDATAAKLRAAQGGSVGVADIGSDMFVAGTPDDCFKAVRRCISETGCDHLMMSFGGPDKLAAMELFGRAVIPAFP